MGHSCVSTILLFQSRIYFVLINKDYDCHTKFKMSDLSDYHIEAMHKYTHISQWAIEQKWFLISK